MEEGELVSSGVDYGRDEERKRRGADGTVDALIEGGEAAAGEHGAEDPEKAKDVD